MKIWPVFLGGVMMVCASVVEAQRPILGEPAIDPNVPQFEKTLAELFVLASKQWVEEEKLKIEIPYSWERNFCNYSENIRVQREVPVIFSSGTLYPERHLSLKEYAKKKIEDGDDLFYQHFGRKGMQEINPERMREIRSAYERLKEGNLAEKLCVRQKILVASSHELNSFSLRFWSGSVNVASDFMKNALHSILISTEVQKYSLENGLVVKEYFDQQEAIQAINRAINLYVDEGNYEKLLLATFDEIAGLNEMTDLTFNKSMGNFDRVLLSPGSVWPPINGGTIVEFGDYNLLLSSAYGNTLAKKNKVIQDGRGVIFGQKETVKLLNLEMRD